MEERRFDDLTRVLGAARSRRQVFRGLLGGVAAALVGRSLIPSLAEAAPFGGCSRQACERRATSDWLTCNASCNNVACGGHSLRGEPNVCLGCLGACIFNYEIAVRGCRASGCSGGEQCCNGNCADLRFDANNCGACGHVCHPGEICAGGVCECGDNGTICNGQCVDTQLDSHNCGSCGHVCDTCKTCVGGTCVDVDCGLGKICCHDQCVDTCPEGQQLDPTTCACNSCQSETDGTSCGTNEVCCGSQCISNQCGAGKQFDLGSCGCVCTPVTCPTGSVQDPDTCECVNRCTFVTCDTCQECDPTTGDCVPSNDGTACGSGLICEQGQCVPVCTQDGVACGDGMICCGGDCIASCSAGKTLNPDTCTCECTPVTCDPGWTQDPDTCQCELSDFCAASCDPYGFVCCTGGSFNYCCLADDVCCGDSCCPA
jgi:hypothetical protein